MEKICFDVAVWIILPHRHWGCMFRRLVSERSLYAFCFMDVLPAFSQEVVPVDGVSETTEPPKKSPVDAFFDHALIHKWCHVGFHRAASGYRSIYPFSSHRANGTDSGIVSF